MATCCQSNSIVYACDRAEFGYQLTFKFASLIAMLLARQAKAAKESAIECAHARVCLCVAQGNGLEPYSEVVGGYQEVFMAIGCSRQARQDVDGDQVHWCTGRDLAKVAMRFTWRPLLMAHPSHCRNKASMSIRIPGQ